MVNSLVFDTDLNVEVLTAPLLRQVGLDCKIVSE